MTNTDIEIGRSEPEKREMERQESALKHHVLILPFPIQGHINPMLQFAKRLAFKGLKVTLGTTLLITKTIQPESGAVMIEPFSDGCDEGGVAQAGGLDAYIEIFDDVGSKNVSALIEGYSTSKHPITCLVYEAVFSWGVDLAKKHGIVGAAFFTQSCAVGAVYYHLQHGTLRTPVEDSITLSMPGLPSMGKNDFPSLVYDSKLYPALAKVIMNQFAKVDETDWLFFNSFDKLEAEVVDWMTKQWPTKMMAIGPTVPSMYLDKQLEGDNDYGLHLLKPDTSTCMSWLNTKEAKSVVYVSFGSLASLGEDQMGEVAWGLRNSESNFLWVVRAAEEEKLPKEFKEEISEKGLVVSWCHQLEVLQHPALGCFVTHCGWNSTLEALSLGVPMVVVPQWTDQTTNAKFVEDVWGVGVRAETDDKGLMKRGEIERCIRVVMEGKKGEEVSKNAVKWKELAKEAMSKGGSSDKNIDKFVDTLISSYV